MKNARKSLLKAFVSGKEIYTAMFHKLCAAEDLYVCRDVLWCAASLFKVLCTNFLPKLKKCCHEIIFFWRSAPFRATSHDLRRLLPEEVMTSKYCRSPSIGIDLRGWCAAKFDQLVFCAGRQKVSGPLIYSLPCSNFFQQSLARIKSRNVNVAPSTE